MYANFITNLLNNVAACLPTNHSAVLSSGYRNFRIIVPTVVIS